MLFLSLCFVYSQEGKWEWARLFDTIGPVNTESFSMDICMDANDNVYIIGVFRTNDLKIGMETLPNRGGYDIFLCSFDPVGNFRWAKSIGSTGNDDIAGLVIDGSDLYIAGAFNGASVYFSPTESLPNSNHYDSFIAHYLKDDGSFQGAKRIFWGSNQQRLQDIVLDNFNDYLVVVGQFKTHLVYNDGVEDDTIPVIGPKDFFIARFDLSGGFDNLLFHDIKSYYGDQESTSLKQVNLSVIGSSHTGYFLSGDLFGTIWFSPTESKVGTSTITSDALVIKLDKNLNYLWSRRGGGTAYDHVNSSGSDNSGNVYLAGKYQNDVTFDSTATKQSAVIKGIGAQDLYLAKYNREGRLLWHYNLGFSGNDDAFGIALTSKYVQVAGNVSDESSTNTGFIKLDLAGNYINQGETHGDGEDIGKGVAFDSEGNTFITGYFNSDTLYFGPESEPDTILVNNTGTYDGFVGKYQYPLTIVREEITDVSCNGEDDGYIRVRGEFGVPPYSWSWEHEINTTPVSDTLIAGTYIVTLTDSDVPANVVTDTIVISEPSLLLIDRIINNVSCYNGNNGAIDISPDGGVGAYTYFWSGGSGLNPTEQDQTNLQAGTYIVRLKDGNGCYLDSTFVISQPPELVVDSMKKWDVSPCGSSNGSAKVFVSGGTPDYSYLWSDDETTDSIGSLDKGDYSVEVTDANGCSVTSGKISIVDSCQVNLIVVEVNHVSCYDSPDGSIILTTYGGQRPYTYYWTPDVGHNDSAAINLQAGSYKIVMEDNIGEKDSVNIELTQPSQLFASAQLTDVICFGESTGKINQSVSGGTPPYTHRWATGGTTEDLTNIPYGNYIDTITDANGCKLIKGYVITQNPEIKVTDFTIDSVSCYQLNDGTIDITVGGGVSPYSYYWLEKNWDPKDGLTTQDIQDLFAGEYNVKITDEVGCFKRDTFIVPQPDPLQIHVDSIKPSCPGRDDGAAWIHATGGNGGYTYTWEPSGKSGDYVTNMPPFDYSVRVEDEKLCWTTDIVTIPENPAITITLDSIRHILCSGIIDGELYVTISGGTLPYSPLWNPDGETTEDIENKPAGTYSVTVTDAANCPKISDDFVIEDQSVPIVTHRQDKTDISCYGLSDGEIVLKAEGLQPLSYSIDGGTSWQSDTLFTDLSTGSYLTVVKDANGCLKYGDPLEITEPAQLIFVSILIDSTSHADSANGVITLTAGGGTEPYTYFLNDSEEPDNVFDGLITGDYIVRIDDANGCSTGDSTVNIPVSVVGGIRSVFEFGELLLYPNPTTGQLTVEIENRNQEDITLEIINLRGQVIWKKELQYSGQSGFVEVIDMSQQTRGTYFMRVNSLPVNTKIILE